ncbi:unnamed protein product [Malus baccata var. baccata]
MKLIIWNCQGIGGDLTVDNLLEANRLHTPDIVILLETKNKSHRYGFLKKSLGLEYMFAVEPHGLSGGLCRMGKRIEQEPDCCLLIGDFNDILCNEEKEGGNYRPASNMRDFREFVASNELMDLGYEGYPFTWRNNRESLPIQQRLDRGLATMGWNNIYPDTTIRHLVLEGSNHAMLVLSTEKIYNQIKGLEDSNGKWHTCDNDICDIANSYFTGLFQSCRPNKIRDVEVCMETRVSPEDNRDLVAPITDEEIKEAAFQIPSDRAPGPDGFSGCFYKDHWTIVGEEVVKAIKAFWHSGSMLRKLNHTNLVLIPKVKCPKNMTQFRPIALCNVIYKILAKVITNRLKKIMPKVIGENQSAFVAGKQIQDNILVVHEILHSLNHQSKDMQKGMAIKLDMAKAYDRVEWDFLLSMMSKMGFAPLFCNRVKECISTVSFSILINGLPTGYIQPQRGLRQGDPLSPFLFLICTEGFSSLIRKGMERGVLHGYKFTPNGIPLTHLFFADDSVLFGNATVEEAQGVVDILNTYASGSGQEINLSKSSIFFGTSTSKRIKKRIGNTLGIPHKDGFGKYLGLQADFGLSKKAVFAEIRDKMEARLAGWSEQFLSQAGKEVMIKAVAMALPNFAMSCFKLPIGCFNLAFLAKIGWRLIQNPTSLLATVLRDKYYPGKCFKEAGKGRNTSWGWKGIFEGRTTWKEEVISAGFNRDEARKILSIPLSKSGCLDRLVWHYTVNGDYSVKTGYGVAMNLMENGNLGKKGLGASSAHRKNNLTWKRIWKLQNMDKAEEILQEVAFGLWRLWKNRNDVVFNGVHRQHLEVMMLWRKNIYEYREALSLSLKSEGQLISKNLKPEQSPQLHWTKPKFGIIKVNTDAAWCSSSLRTGVGWVGRDFAGLLQFAGGSGIGICHSAAAAEACAIRSALVACIENGFDKVIIESDALVIIKMLSKVSPQDYSIECILGDIEILVRRLMSVTFSFVPRESNHAAHSVAKFAFQQGGDYVWDCIGPKFLFNILARDVNIPIRL